MLQYLLQGGTIIWPLLLSSVAARATLSVAETYRPAADASPEERLDAEVEAVSWVIFNLVHEKRW